MFKWMDGWMDTRRDGCLDDGCLNGWMFEWMDV